jgi:surface polysaccharide O-acyltransferase-like enzyme
MGLPTSELVCCDLDSWTSLTCPYISLVFQRRNAALTMDQLENDFGNAGVNITQEGNFYKSEYKFKLTPLWLVQPLVKLGVGRGKI